VNQRSATNSLHTSESGSGVLGEVTLGQVVQARQELGRMLAAWRDAAGLTQRELARRVSYSRSSVANAEIGRHSNTREFWIRADHELNTKRALLAAYDDLDQLVQARHTQAAQALDRHRAVVHTPDGCGCGLAVGRWTGRETRALREALRMNVSTFAEHLGVRPSTVSGWERQHTPTPPSLPTQAGLDEILKHADPDARTRFALLLDTSPYPHTTATGGSTAGRSTVTQLRRPAGTRTAS
jgi:transcriptional regulator with XRE-family HTH domain